MLGERRDQTTAGQEGGRAKAAERKKMWIKLAIESSEFQTFSDNLRVHGIIEEAQFDIGSHHTHIVEIRDEIELHHSMSSQSRSRFDRTGLFEQRQSKGRNHRCRI